MASSVTLASDEVMAKAGSDPFIVPNLTGSPSNHPSTINFDFFSQL
jgi:hypothetical protein